MHDNEKRGYLWEQSFQPFYWGFGGFCPKPPPVPPPTVVYVAGFHEWGIPGWLISQHDLNQ